jgi:hypothetical protein
MDRVKTYEWDTVAIGGGGYVTGIVIHPSMPDVWYVRTDVGGAYRWDAQQRRLVQMLGWIPPGAQNLYGCYGLDIDPENSDCLYVALGRHPKRSPSGVFKSTDRGKSWIPLGLEKSMGANYANFNRFSKPLVVNPYDSRFVWCGTVGDGLYVYDNRSQQWEYIESVPHGESIRRVAFSPVEPDRVFIAVRGVGVMAGSDSEKQFSLIRHSPEDIIDMNLSADGERIYCATNNGIYLYDNSLSVAGWIDITPPAQQREYRTVATDPRNPYRLCTAPKEMRGVQWIYLSEDGGRSWVQKNSCRVQRSVPWHSDDYPGAAISMIAFDPHTTSRVFFTDWYSVYCTENIDVPKVEWNNEVARGHEELVVIAICAMPENPADVLFFSGSADVGGLRHTSLEHYPEIDFKTNCSPELREVTSIDFCESKPGSVILHGATRWEGDEGIVAISNDYGATFRCCEGYEKAWGWGKVAISSTNPLNAVAVTKRGGVRYTMDGGKRWEQGRNAPADAIGSGRIFSLMHPIAGDRVNGKTFYIYRKNDGTMHRSTNGGKTWKCVCSTLPVHDSEQWNCVPVFGKRGHLWLALDTEGLFFSENGGEHWDKIACISDATLVAVGKPESEQMYPAIYIFGKAVDDTESWCYRSCDRGERWERINDSGTRMGNSPRCMSADRGEFGRVYVGTAGTGILCGRIGDSNGRQNTEAKQ